MTIEWSSLAIMIIKTNPTPLAARKLGISEASVRSKRKELGFNTPQKRKPYRERKDTMWDKMSDDYKALIADTLMPSRAVAKAIGVSHQTIINRRIKLGIHRPRTYNDYHISHQLIAKLGNASDASLAKEFGIPYWRIRQERTQRNIPVYSKTKSDLANERLLDLLGSKPDKDVAKIVGMSQSWVALRRNELGIAPFQKKINWFSSVSENEILNGSPEEIAKRVGVSVESVYARRYQVRKEAGLNTHKASTRAWARWTNEEIAQLGSMSDNALAIKLGRTLDGVKLKRLSLKIPSYRASLTPELPSS